MYTCNNPNPNYCIVLIIHVTIPITVVLIIHTTVIGIVTCIISTTLLCIISTTVIIIHVASTNTVVHY